MCGIAGALDLSGARRDFSIDRLLAMTGAITHRGPDDDVGTDPRAEEGPQHPDLRGTARTASGEDEDVPGHGRRRSGLGEDVRAVRKGCVPPHSPFSIGSRGHQLSQIPSPR